MTLLLGCCALAGMVCGEVWYVPGWNRTTETNGLAYASCTNVFADAVCVFKGWDGDRGWWTSAKNADQEGARLAAEIAALPEEARADLTLVGHSLGGRIIARALARLAARGVAIRQGILLAPAIPMRDADVAKMGGGAKLPVLVVVNPEDTVLKYVYTLSGAEKPALGADGTPYPIFNVAEYAVSSDITCETKVDAAWGRSETVKRICNHLAVFYFEELRRVLAGTPSPQAQTRVVQDKINVAWKVMDAGVWWDVLASSNGWKLEKNVVTGHCRILDPERRRRAWGRETRMRESFRALAR